MSATDSMKETVAEHPRLVGFLFAAMVLMSQAGAVAASAADTAVGP
jgi:hypothetical protein